MNKSNTVNNRNILKYVATTNRLVTIDRIQIDTDTLNYDCQINTV